MIEINERIKLYAFFDGSKITPIAFSWKGRRYEKLKQVGSWQMRRGQWLDNWFALSDGANVYQIRFEQDSFCWKMMKVMTE